MSGPQRVAAVSTGPTRTTGSDIASLEQASKLLQEQHLRDAALAPDLKELLAGSPAASPAYLPQLDTPWDLYQRGPLFPIPEALFSHIQTTNARSFLGFLPQLDRAWITVEEKLFLWDYVHGEFDTFSDQTETIITITLAKPKPGVFVDDIKHLMVVCTIGTVFLIGISVGTSTDAQDGPRKVLKLYATDMSISTKSMTINTVGTTAEGRIFLTGNDGHLYELLYTSTESWFSDRISLKNHTASFGSSILPTFLSGSVDATIWSIVVDDQRKCLYTVASNQTISVWYLGADGREPNISCRGTLRDIGRQAQNLAPGANSLDPRTFEIAALSIISPQEAQSDVHCVIITTKGVRIYLTHRGASAGYPYGYGAQTISQPADLRILQVRLPPSQLLLPADGLSHRDASDSQLASRTFQISHVSSALYSRGLLLLSHPPAATDVNRSNTLICLFPDGPSIAPIKFAPTQNSSYAGPSFISYQRPPLTENVKLIPVLGETWDIAEWTNPSSGASLSPYNELAAQFSQPHREFAVLSPMGVTPFVKLRPVDVLYSLIQKDSRPELEIFMKSFGRDQTCAMLYAILAKNSFIVREATGRETSFRSGRMDVTTNSRQVLLTFGGKPTWSATQLIEFSGRLMGLCIYLARLIQPVWNFNVVKLNAQKKAELALSEEILLRTRQNLQTLRELFDADPFLFQAPPGEHRNSTETHDDAWKVEIGHAQRLLSLVSHTAEAISFVLLLHDFNLADIISRCDQGDQQRIASITFSQLITSSGGRDLARSLVNSVITQQINQQINVDTISDVLQQRCGSFCSSDDVMLYKADENVRKAGDSRQPSEKTQLLLESLVLYSKGCKHITFDKLQDIVVEYRRLRYARGAVELPLRCAQEWDADKSGRDYWLAGCPAHDPRGEAYQARVRCYNLVLESLQAFDEAVNTARGSNGMDVVVDDSQQVSQNAYRMAFGSSDVAFHSTLYDWLIQRGSADELLEVDALYLESHLQREPLTLKNGELLWQYYVKNGQFLKAAETLQGLAESARFSLSLDQRIEFLSLAVGNAKSHPISQTEREANALGFLTDLEEKLEVAQVQAEILRALQSEFRDQDPYIQEKVFELGSSFKTVTQLWEEYAEPLNLPETKLLLLHVSDHQDVDLVISIWRYIFEKVGNAETMADEFSAISNLIERMGRRFYPSTSAFPPDYILKTLEDMSIKNRNYVPAGWAPRVLHRANVPYELIFELMYQMYESQVPPYNVQENVQALSADLSVILEDWLNAVLSPRPTLRKADFPADTVLRVVDAMLKELSPASVESRRTYESLKTRIRQEF